jgi:hypothetical protein
MVNKVKTRLKTLLNKSLIQYADGMDFVKLNKVMSKIKKTKNMVELDLSKQDRQTDAPILDFERDFLVKLGMKQNVVDWLGKAHEGYTAKTSDGITLRRPGQRWTGGCMTALGNEIRNLILLHDVCKSKDIEFVFTLGDDSLIWTDDDSWDHKTVMAICMELHNVICTYSLSTTTALFLQLIVGYVPGMGYRCCASWMRLRERLSYMTHDVYSYEHFAKVYSYLMMVGHDQQTEQVADYIGLNVFVNIGTTEHERLLLNQMHHGGNVTTALGIKLDLLNTMKHPRITLAQHLVYSETDYWKSSKPPVDINPSRCVYQANMSSKSAGYTKQLVFFIPHATSEMLAQLESAIEFPVLNASDNEIEVSLTTLGNEDIAKWLDKLNIDMSIPMLTNNSKFFPSHKTEVLTLSTKSDSDVSPNTHNIKWLCNQMRQAKTRHDNTAQRTSEAVWDLSTLLLNLA